MDVEFLYRRLCSNPQRYYAFLVMLTECHDASQFPVFGVGWESALRSCCAFAADRIIAIRIRVCSWSHVPLGSGVDRVTWSKYLGWNEVSRILEDHGAKHFTYILDRRSVDGQTYLSPDYLARSPTNRIVIASGRLDSAPENIVAEKIAFTDK